LNEKYETNKKIMNEKLETNKKITENLSKEYKDLQNKYIELLKKKLIRLFLN